MASDSLYKRIEEITKRRSELTYLLSKEVNYLDQNKIPHNIMLTSEYMTANSPENYKSLKNKVSDVSFHTNLKNKITEIPNSNGSQYFNKLDTKIGLLADEFLYNSFKDVANFKYISKNIKKEELESFDLVIIASAWKGLNNDWRGMANPDSRVRAELLNLIRFMKRKSIKVVFYSKEDPTNYEKFIGIAKECDHIFTTALEKVPSYKRDCNTEKVSVLEFGVNPIYNNPIGINLTEKYTEAIFAGSWYEKYPHRIHDSKVLFDGMLLSGKGLRIIDRNYDLDLPNHYFPEKYLPYISPSLDHKTLQKTFKLFNWVLNLNSVKDSDTMFANRVYELQAMGNLILSNYSLGINNKFPNIFMAHDTLEVAPIVNNVSADELYEHQMLGVRKVLNEHTTFHRIHFLLNTLGMEEESDYNKKVAIVTKDLTKETLVNFERQTYPNKELILINELQDKYNSFEYITFFDDRYTYGEYYIEDMINGFKYTDSDYITKDSYVKNGTKIEGIEHNYVSEVKDKYRTVFATSKFDYKFLINLNKPTKLQNGYSIDRLEIVEGNKNLNKINFGPFKLSVIIPVYNNGDHLFSKCFMSLRRSSIFKNMEIILVDDGSTDDTTIRIVKRLTRRYENVKSYLYTDGGSGSASRPRNKGIELASTEFITYLDPDNEAINDGYAKLFTELENDSTLDMVVGNIVKFDKSKKNLNYAHNLINYSPSGIVDNTYEFLIDSKMRAQSIQALIVKKEVILNNNLRMVEKATGQDTLFFQELLLNSKKVKGINELIHIYYAAVSNSVTNTISKNFYEKYLILEKERFRFLMDNNLLKTYMRERFNFYFRGWYLSRVIRIKDSDLIEALEKLGNIYKIYKPYIENESKELKTFYKLLRKKKYSKVKEYCWGIFASDNAMNDKGAVAQSRI